MVATSGRGWKLAPCLNVLFKEADKRKPSRSHASDGTIGDTAHAARKSDHNPANGWVTAGDVDDDGDSTPVLGVDHLVAHLVATRDPRVKYIIRNGRIWDPRRGWRHYTGASPHDHHAHISVWNTPEARNDLRPWWPVAKPPAHTSKPSTPGAKTMAITPYPPFTHWRDPRPLPTSKLYRVAADEQRKVSINGTARDVDVVNLAQYGYTLVEQNASTTALQAWLDSIPTSTSL